MTEASWCNKPSVPILSMQRRLTPIVCACKALTHILRFERQLARQGGHVWTFGVAKSPLLRAMNQSSGPAVR